MPSPRSVTRGQPRGRPDARDSLPSAFAENEIKLERRVEQGSQPLCRVIAGPNGAGKTTFALRFLRTESAGQVFINADLIAAGLAPLDPQSQLQQASRLMLQELHRCVARRRSFAFETTLSGRGYLRLIHQLRASGWRVELIYLALPSLEASVQRVAERVAHGGHAVPRETLHRRFPRSLRLLLQAYAGAADETICLMNSSAEPQPIFRQVGDRRTIMDGVLYDLLLRQSR